MVDKAKLEAALRIFFCPYNENWELTPFPKNDFLAKIALVAKIQELEPLGVVIIGPCKLRLDNGLVWKVI